MRFLWSVLGLSLIAGAVALMLPAWRDLLLLSLPCAVASAFLIVRAGGSEPGKDVGREPVRTRVVVDGSNVMYWHGAAPSLAPVHAVLNDLRVRGLAPGVVFDANAGYKIGDRYRDDDAFASLLNLPGDDVLVVPKGTQADGFILASARRIGARVVSNDRYRDWEQAYPEVRQPGFLIRGGFREGVLWLDLTRDDPPV